jgi:hypothetical protein
VAPDVRILYRSARRAILMVAFRVGDFQVASLDDDAFALVLEAAAQAGGPSAFPVLYTLADADAELDPMAFVDDLARLASTESGRSVAHSIGALRDDLMEALAAADEG